MYFLLVKEQIFKIFVISNIINNKILKKKKKSKKLKKVKISQSYNEY